MLDRGKGGGALYIVVSDTLSVASTGVISSNGATIFVVKPFWESGWLLPPNF
jgi:hypothetical protein